MASTPACEQPTMDPYKFLGIYLKPDGSTTRTLAAPISPATPELKSDSQLTLSKDIPLNPTNGTFVRLFRPVSPPTKEKLPIIVYTHGGGFVLHSATTTSMHDTCIQLSAQSPALVVSVEYRLAPEHRLPAAYDDWMDAFQWLREQASKTECDEWLNEISPDFSKVYLMGTSAGGNITYMGALRLVGLDLHPIKIMGVVLDQPFFGGVERTESEIRFKDNEFLPLVVTDVMWSFTLPEGSDRDHEFCNPLGDRHRYLDEKIKQLPKCLMRVNGEDPLGDKQKEFAKKLEELGVQVTRRFYEKGVHTEELGDPIGPKAQMLYDDVKAFIGN